MNCPICGYDMGNKSKCIRCGYENKTLVVLDDREKTDGQDGQAEQKQNDRAEKEQVIEIDPTNVYLTHPYGVEDESGTGFGPFGSPFSSLFDDLFGVDPITELLGGLFGFDVVPPRRPPREDPPKKRKKQGPVVEVNEVEFVDDNGNPIDADTADTSASRPHGDGANAGKASDPPPKQKKHKHPFARRKRK